MSDRWGNTVGPIEAVAVDNFNVNTLEEDAMAGGSADRNKPEGMTHKRRTPTGKSG
jgi:hypothetical protein